ncbi:uncharacterized protein PADG_12160 [Paracoccidioides brasiliensis Pb18]|uniref:Transporter n=1 Tax=Paracoccidioides brasiliensis (strain Pb18) TaxID=502780 RepID=A0A0A0HR94_PARBD|nr:uncharacterized protein PADG_12160 [Paracoccidioides brasiliensis Pb18]KGM91704.1 hypothetical protein PADG_12160 [Paracoccidioides brasiliensis Pb18]
MSFTLPKSFLNANTPLSSYAATLSFNNNTSSPFASGVAAAAAAAAALPSSPTSRGAQPPLPNLALLVFEAVLEVVCVSLPGYIVARMGMFDANAQKFVANLNIILFTPCLVFTKLASQLTADKLTDLAIIPFIFAIQTLISYFCSVIVSRVFRFKKRQSNFVVAMGVFGNSNSLPISLVLSLSQTIQGLHWDRIPNDNDNEVAARGILYLLIFQQLGQLLRWSWGYRVLLAPPETYYRDEEERVNTVERYTDEPDQTLIDTSDVVDVDGGDGVDDDYGQATSSAPSSSGDVTQFESGGATPIISRQYSFSKLAGAMDDSDVEIEQLNSDSDPCRPLSAFHQLQPKPLHPWHHKLNPPFLSALCHLHNTTKTLSQRAFHSLPLPLQKFLRTLSHALTRFLIGTWHFMNPPLWAMLFAILVASIPSLQRLLFTRGTFLSNSVTRAVEQSGAVAVPLILVVLGANLARNTLPTQSKLDCDLDSFPDEPQHPKEERNLIIASLLSRMLLPTLFMSPLLALAAKYIPVSILDDPIFIVVCFLLTGAPSALQLAQICQLNNVYMPVMARLLFQGYVVWILPSTLVLVMLALEVVRWATAA